MMTESNQLMKDFELSARGYLSRLYSCFTEANIGAIYSLAIELRWAWENGKSVYICGNGGSAANAIHLANDFHYGIGACGSKEKLPGLKVEALPANTSVITCLANDTDYDNIYSHQLEVKGHEGDVLIVLSGSGNSSNIVKSLKTAKQIGIKSFAVLAFSGGKCKDIADVAIHFAVNDMQIAEDTQLVVGHLCMQWLNKNKPKGLPRLH